MTTYHLQFQADARIGIVVEVQTQTQATAERLSVEMLAELMSTTFEQVYDEGITFTHKGREMTLKLTAIEPVSTSWRHVETYPAEESKP